MFCMALRCACATWRHSSEFELNKQKIRRIKIHNIWKNVKRQSAAPLPGAEQTHDWNANSIFAFTLGTAIAWNTVWQSAATLLLPLQLCVRRERESTPIGRQPSRIPTVSNVDLDDGKRHRQFFISFFLYVFSSRPRRVYDCMSLFAHLHLPHVSGPSAAVSHYEIVVIIKTVHSTEKIKKNRKRKFGPSVHAACETNELACTSCTILGDYILCQYTHCAHATRSRGQRKILQWFYNRCKCIECTHALFLPSLRPSRTRFIK